jgi:hypothetical protein
MQVRNSISLTREMLAIFSKACELTWMGEHVRSLAMKCLLNASFTAQTLLVFIL